MKTIEFAQWVRDRARARESMWETEIIFHILCENKTKFRISLIHNGKFNMFASATAIVDSSNNEMIAAWSRHHRAVIS